MRKAILAAALLLVAVTVGAQDRPTFVLTTANQDELSKVNDPNVIVRDPVELSASRSWYVHDLTFEQYGSIAIGEHDLSLVVNGTITRSGPGLLQFRGFLRRAPNGRTGDSFPPGSGIRGGNGTADDKGRDTGTLFIVLRGEAVGRFGFELAGQSGGDGGSGGNGGSGKQGAAGRRGDSGPVRCKRPSSPGVNGWPGGDGGNGGDGGECGQDGRLDGDLGKGRYQFEKYPTRAYAGVPGRGGNGGKGGAGGAGGPKTGGCSAAPDGRPGRDGDPGRPGNPAPGGCPTRN